MQHGPHLPLDTDARITTAVAEGIGAAHGILVAPTLPFSEGAEADRAYAGTATLAHKTLHRTLNNIVADWEAQGLRQICILTSNGYGPNYRSLVSVVGGTLRIRAVDTNVVDLGSVLGLNPGPERAGEIETSLLLHLAPDLVRAELAQDHVVDPVALRARVDGTEPVPLPGSTGVVGRPTAATSEKGRRIYEYLVHYIGGRLFGAEAKEA